MRTELTLVFKQNALQLGGTFNPKHTSPDNNYDIQFDARGAIWEGYASIGFTPVDRKVTSFATMLLKMSGGGQALAGQIVFRNVNEETVNAQAVMLHRAT